MVREPIRRRFKFDVRDGDLWEFQSNNGFIPRTVTFVGDGRVEYINASGNRCDCSVPTFRRWCRGADLAWRDPKYPDPPPPTIIEQKAPPQRIRNEQ